MTQKFPSWLLSISMLMILSIEKIPCQSSSMSGLAIRKSPVSYHLSFDDDEFFKEDIIEQSGKKSLLKRKIVFPTARFGKGISMTEIPSKPDANNMTGIDLDMVTAVIFNTQPGNQMGFNQPFIWGSGRINARLGSLAFWARGELAYPGPLFEQTSVGFGRKERDLLGILIDDDNVLSAYIRDARYIRHTIKSNTVWNPSGWNHLVLNWDWANGLELLINGEIIASSWGKDAWFETTLPGLFHLPAAGLIYDELYLFDRPLSLSEIKSLMDTNTPPAEESQVYVREKINERKVAEVSGAHFLEHLPVIQPNKLLRFSEVWPESVSDGRIPGWYVMDGRNEIAWPHPYSMFTIIPGDADFHAEKVDIKTMPGSKVNYAFLSGNLSNVSLLASTPRHLAMHELIAIPDGKQFSYASTFTAQEGATFRIPFTESHGTPKGFSGDVNLPLSGEKRLQNIGLYHVDGQDIPMGDEKGKKLILGNLAADLDRRTQFAIHALSARDERKFYIATDRETNEPPTKVNVGYFSRLNILSDPYGQDRGINSISLVMPIKTKRRKEALFVRLRDPAVPSRLWNHLVVALEGFDAEFEIMRLEIDFQDIVVASGDRLWIDIGVAGNAEVLMGDQQKQALIHIEEIQTYLAMDDYTDKEIISAKAQYAKMYEFMPWQFTGKTVDLNSPYCYGGPFDMVLPAQAINRVNPNHFVANYLLRMCGPDFRNGKPVDPFTMPLISLPNPTEAPEWALYMYDFNAKRHRIADWWAERQNDDGQLGGGWNDDVLFLSSHQPDLPLDGNEHARYLIDATHKGLEKTNYFKDGYCNILPMDRMHIGDFISERYNTLVNNLGQAYAFERELESAWRLDDGRKTPINYFADGFKSSVNVIEWYWGRDVPQTPYVSKGLDELTEEFRRYTSVLDDYSIYRFTDSDVHRDDFSPYGANNMYTYMLGGPRGTRLDAHLKLAVIWPSGGGPDLARVILYADDQSLEVVAYSFDSNMRELMMRLCRIEHGSYRIRIHEDPGGMGNEGKILWEEEKDLNRFDVIRLPIPPQVPVLIKLEQINSKNQSLTRPDLVIDPWDAMYDHNAIGCTVHNLGNGAAENVVVRLYNGEEVLDEINIERLLAPVDFVAKRKRLTFHNVTFSGNLSICIDPDDEIQEILEDNNQILVYEKGVHQIGLAPKSKTRN